MGAEGPVIFGRYFNTGLCWTSVVHMQSPLLIALTTAACITTGSGRCCFVMSLVVRFQTVSGIVLFFASVQLVHFDLAK